MYAHQLDLWVVPDSTRVGSKRDGMMCCMWFEVTQKNIDWELDKWTSYSSAVPPNVTLPVQGPPGEDEG